MQIKLAVSILGAALCAGAAFAQAPEELEMDTTAPAATDARPNRPEAGLRRADTNRDGKVSFEELHAVRPESTPERFKTLDTNGDGFLGPEDRPAGDRVKAKKATTPTGEGRREVMQMLMKTDANQDGKTSYAEVTTAKPGYSKTDFDRVDRDKDGFITAADTTRAPEVTDRPKKPGDDTAAAGARAAKITPEQREKLRARLNKADANADGYVSREEARTGLPNVTDERFKAMDRNSDGKLGPEDAPAGAPKAN